MGTEERPASSQPQLTYFPCIPVCRSRTRKEVEDLCTCNKCFLSTFPLSWMPQLQGMQTPHGVCPQGLHKSEGETDRATAVIPTTAHRSDRGGNRREGGGRSSQGVTAQALRKTKSADRCRVCTGRRALGVWVPGACLQDFAVCSWRERREKSVRQKQESE